MTNLSRATAILSFFLFFIAPLASAADACIDINTAPQNELERIKHIGESRAKQIIVLRGEKLFSSVDELDRVIGIGPARISDIKQEGLACVQTQATVVKEAEIKPIIKDLPPIIATPTTEIQPPKIYPTGIIFNEILPSPEGKDEEGEWIELFNKNESAIDLSGWKISDITGSVVAYTFPEGTQINPRGFLVLLRPETKITLNNGGDGLKLIRPDEKIVDSISYENASRGNSYNFIDGKWSWSASLTPGSANISSFNIREEKTDSAKKISGPASLPAEKQLSFAGKQIFEPRKQSFPFLAALAAAITSGICILFFKKRLVSKP